MSGNIIAQPENLLDENFNPEEMHPADIEQVLISAFEEYEAIPTHGRIRKLYRDAYNKLVDLITEKRGFKQFNYL